MENKCLICGRAANVEPLQYLEGTYNNCKHCGKIHLELDAEILLNNDQGAKFRSCLYYYFSHFRKNNGKPYLVIKDNIEGYDYNIVTIEEIMNLYPKNISERIDMILLNIAAIADYVGAEIPIKNDRDLYMHILFIANKDAAPAERYTLLEMMKKKELIIAKEIVKPNNEQQTNCIIDYKGWQRINELNKRIKTRKQGFIAMWFPEDHSMDECRKAIEEVFLETGYNKMIIDEKQHNNQIVPEILYEIKMSDFVVADLRLYIIY